MRPALSHSSETKDMAARATLFRWLVVLRLPLVTAGGGAEHLVSINGHDKRLDYVYELLLKSA